MENLIDRRIFSIEEVHFEIGNAKQEALMIFQDEPAPGVVFVHGHKSNGWKSLIYGKYLHNEGYAVCLPSQRGYGFSEGESDFCGPDTLAGVQKAVEIFLDDPRVNGRIAIWGRSRGAIVTAQLIARMNNFRGAVLQAGSYDLQKDYAIPKPGRLDGIRRTIESQIKGELQAGLHDRSAIHNVSRISCPVLLLHGEKDENVRVEQARMMDEALSAANVPHELRIIPEAAHDIERETRLQFTMPFLRKVLAQ